MTNLVPPLAEAPRPSAHPISLAFSSLLVAVLLIGAGGLVDYLYGYKDSWLLEGTYVLLLVFGWLALFMAAIAALMTNASASAPAPSDEHSGLGRLLNILKLVGFGIGFLACIALMVGSLVYLEQRRNERIARLLATAPTATTAATVTELRARSRRSGTTYATLLTYRAGTEPITQAIPGRGLYTVGQQVRVKYVVEHPDMFEVVE